MVELDALPTLDREGHLTTHELMDLALSWEVVKSATDFWQAHKSKEDLIGALYDSQAARAEAHFLAEQRRQLERARANEEREAAEAAEAAVAAAQRSRSRAPSAAGLDAALPAGGPPQRRPRCVCHLQRAAAPPARRAA